MTNTQADFDGGPEQDGLAVGVGFEVLDGEDAEDLDDGYEEAEREQAD